MGPLQDWLIRLIAATAAKAPPRRPGIEAFIPSMAMLGPLFAVPIALLLLGILKLATQSDPLVRLPYAGLAVESLCGGVILVAELVRIWRDRIDQQLARYDRLDALTRARWRALTLLGGLTAFAPLLVLLALALQL